MQLLLQATWKTDAAGLLLAQQRASTLISLFTECAEAQLPFSCDWAFNTTDGAWLGYAGTSWVVFSGWQANITASSPCTQTLAIHKVLPANTTLTRVRVVGNRSSGVGGALHNVYVTIGGVQSSIGTLPTTVGAFDVTLTGTWIGVTDLEIDDGSAGASPACVTPSVITSVQLDGSNPTGTCP